MILLLNFLLLFVGLFLVVKGADFLVEGSCSIAKKLNIPDIVIGMTLVAFGTSAPELIVNIFASIKKSGDIVLGNIVGSNIFNTLPILGISAMIYPITVKRNTALKEVPFTLLTIVVLFLVANFSITGNKNLLIDRFESSILLFLFILFLIYNYKLAKKGEENEFMEELEEIKIVNLPLAIFLSIAGLVLLFFGGKITVDSAVDIARSLGITEKLIALTIISAGTSLPELATSAVAAFKKKSDIAIGNVVGSNIFNVLFIIGISGVIYPVSFNTAMNFDIVFLFITTLFFWVTLFLIKRYFISRFEGFLYFSIYIGYIVYILYRG